MTTDMLLLKVTCPSHHADRITCALIEAGSEGVEERDNTTMTAACKEMTEIIAGFHDAAERIAARQALSALPISTADIQMEDMDDIGEDWKDRWREFFQPQVLSILQIVTPWMSMPREDRIPIIIDPGQAFGTGGHATTRMILEMMERRFQSIGLPDRAADIGSGSGILSIAARKLGVSEVIGVDIEEESVSAFFENAKRNGIANGLNCRVGTAANLRGSWPLVLANLQIDIFRVAAADIAALVALQGEILVSGILIDQVDECIALWQGFQVTERCEEDEWAALALTQLS